jgi:hypothetical protein
MKLCKAQFVRVCLLLAAALFLIVLPASAQLGQHGMLGLDFGETTDRFGALPRSTAAIGDVSGQFTVLSPSGIKEGWPSLVAGGEIRFPSDTSNHATEFAVFAGLMFRVNPNLSVGFHGQVRKIYLPSSTVDGQIFSRDKMELLETPLVIQYKFGPERRAFVEAQGFPGFTPRFRPPSTGDTGLPSPDLDHSYSIRGTVGYNFGKWYARASYETRYFKFTDNNLGNPNGLYNWRSDNATAGVGLVF